MPDLDIKPVRKNVNSATAPATEIAKKSALTPPTNDQGAITSNQNQATPATAKPAGPPEQKGFRKWIVLLVLSLALAIIIIDTTLLNVSLRNIIVDLNTDIKGLQWVISAYALTLAALTITGGRLGDLYGRKRMFMLGAVIFAVGSFLASISHQLSGLLVGESLIEGVGAALMMPATASLLVANFRGRDRAIAFGVWGSIAGASSAIGPILGGYLTTHYSWRWGFRINIVVTALLVIGALLFIRESRDTAERPQLDIVGTFLSGFGLLAVIFGVIQSSSFGWIRATEPYEIFGHSLGNISITAYSIAVGVLFLAAFFFWEKRRERRGQTPLVSMGIFKIRQFTSGAFTMASMTMAMTGLIFVVPVFLQSVRGLDALHTGLALLPLSIGILIMGPVAGILSHKTTPKYVIQAGLVVNLIAVIVLYLSLGVNTTALALAPAFALYGVGMGFVMAPVSNLTLSSVSVQQAGEASGVNNTMRQVASSLGSAILGALLLSTITAKVTSGINDSAVIPEAAKPQIVATVGGNASNAAFGGSDGESAQGNIPPAIVEEIKTIAKESTTDATRRTLLFGVPFTILAILVSTTLPKKHNIETEKSIAGGH